MSEKLCRLPDSKIHNGPRLELSLTELRTGCAWTSPEFSKEYLVYYDNKSEVPLNILNRYAELLKARIVFEGDEIAFILGEGAKIYLKAN